MSDESDYIGGWICRYCEQTNPFDGNGNCETPNCDGTNPAVVAKIEEFLPDA